MGFKRYFCVAAIYGRGCLKWFKSCRAIQPQARLLYPQKLPPLPPTRAAAKGQFQTHAVQQRTSILDHLVGKREYSRRQFQSECLCRLEVDNELKFCRLLKWEIAWFFAP